MGKIVVGSKEIDTEFMIRPGKELIEIDKKYSNKLLTFKISKVTFTGVFIDTPAGPSFEKPPGTAAEKETELLRVTTRVEDNQFGEQSKLTGLSLPEVTYIGDYAFFKAPLTSLDIPKVVTIYGKTFQSAYLTGTLDLPNVQYIGGESFANSQFSALNLPEVTYIGWGVFGSRLLTSIYAPKLAKIDGWTFYNTINAPTTHVTLPAKWNNNHDKDALFPSNGWDKITFTWVP